MNMLPCQRKSRDKEQYRAISSLAASPAAKEARMGAKELPCSLPSMAPPITMPFRLRDASSWARPFYRLLLTETVQMLSKRHSRPLPCGLSQHRLTFQAGR